MKKLEPFPGKGRTTCRARTSGPATQRYASKRRILTLFNLLSVTLQPHGGGEIHTWFQQMQNLSLSPNPSVGCAIRKQKAEPAETIKLPTTGTFCFHDDRMARTCGSLKIGWIGWVGDDASPPGMMPAMMPGRPWHHPLASSSRRKTRYF